jgi:parvulin-like peptidyl-prolyl isomerase
MAVGQEGARKPAAAPIATVGTMSIAREDFERRAVPARAEFAKRRGQQLTGEYQAMLDRQVLEGMIRAHLLVLEARRTGITASLAEAEAELRKEPFFNPGGTFDPNRYQAIKTNDPDGFRRSIERARDEIAARKLSERLRRQAAPEEARLRAIAERSLATASIDYLLLPRFEFTGDYPEPRESEVIDWYRTHADDFRRPARAALSVIRIEDGPIDSNRRRADSLLAAIRGGAAFDEAGEAEGGVERNVIVQPGNFPGTWRVDDKLSGELFRAPPGVTLSQPVATERGWLLVRVDENRPAQVAPLAEVAVDIRNALRRDRQEHFEGREVRALYERERERFRGPAFRLRYAAADTARLDPGKPTAADLDRFYRAHLADYTSYDAATASMVSTPLAQVREEVARRWDQEQRLLLARAWADRMLKAWSGEARDRQAERQATLLREVGPYPPGAQVDTGLAGRALSDTLRARGYELGAGTLPYARGTVVYQIVERVADYTPSFEEIRPVLSRVHQQQRMDEEEKAARALFDRDPQRFATGRTLHYSRILVPPPSQVDVPLTRAEIERYHRENLNKYSTPEQVRARHILISPTGNDAAADAAARKKAEGVLARVRAGEDFAALALRYSDDPPTKEHGGDLGWFSRGAMLEPVERAVFAMQAGEVSDLVKSEVGYHILHVIDRTQLSAEPLDYIYTNVGVDAATEKALRIAQRTADSLYQRIRTPADGARMARAMNLDHEVFRHAFGNTHYPDHLRPVMARLENVAPGKLHPGVVSLKSLGWAVLWVDSVTAAHAPTWEEARPRVIEAYVREAGLRSLESKRAELDSMLAAGWTLDSLATLWGGLQRVDPLKAGQRIRRIGTSGPIDSLVFGGRRAAALAPGETSGWVDLPAGLLQVRLVERRAPNPVQLGARLEAERRLAVERHLFDYYEDLKKRHAVRILDPRLRDVIIPPPPPENAPF